MPEIIACPKCGESFGPHIWRRLVCLLGEQSSHIETSDVRRCDACGQTSITKWPGWPEERPENCEFTCLN